MFAEIAEECRTVYGPDTRLTFLCGRDAAERIVGWDYGERGAIERMLRRFDLLVADRGGEYRPPEPLAEAIGRIVLPEAMELVSASEVRGRIARGESWEHLVPDAIRERVRRIYGPS